MTTQCFSKQCQASPLVVQFYYTRCCQCYSGGWLMSELYALTTLCDFHKPCSTRVSAAVTSFNHRLVRILSGRACPTAVRIKQRLVVVSQVNLYWALEICGAQRGEKKKKNRHMCVESVALTHPPALVLSYLSSHAWCFSLSTFFYTIQASEGLASRFHFSLLHSHLFILVFWPPVFIALLSWDCMFQLPRLSQSKSPLTSLMPVCHSFWGWGWVELCF